MKIILRNRWIAHLLLAIASFVSMSGAAFADRIIYYHNDLLGSPVVATRDTPAGEVIWREFYRPYGERGILDPASAKENIWFTSRHEDANTELLYMGARYYDPIVGRFLSVDSLRFKESNIHSFNRYAYGNNNPFTWVDPNGRDAYIMWHPAATKLLGNPYMHASILLIPQDPSRFSGETGWTVHNDALVSTLGGQPGGGGFFQMNDIFGKLHSTPNNPGDAFLGATGWAPLPAPPGVSDTDWIIYLRAAARSYEGNLGYAPFPGITIVESFNSNSYVSGVIKAAGGQPPIIPNVSLPGYDRPIPLPRVQPDFR